MQHNTQQPELIDLGAASAETRGLARYNQDVGGGERTFIPASLDD